MGQPLIRVGTRASALARTQTNLVVANLQQAHPQLAIEVVPITTGGDRSQATNRPSGDWGSGVFVVELEAALLRGEVDLAVHSLKDVPPELTAGLVLAAIPSRDDPLDVLVTPDGCPFTELERGARVGTSSARRAAFLGAARPDLAWLPIRGNVETRLRKLHEGQYDALVLARAGLRRLGLQVPHVVLEPELLPPAPGQGALAIQARADDHRLLDLLQPLHHPPTAAAVRAERSLMALLQGGCRLPLGALATPSQPGRLSLLGGVASQDLQRVLIDRVDGPLLDPESLAHALAARLQAAGASALLPSAPVSVAHV